MKYIDNLPSNLASEVMKISMRTYFRKITIALDNFWENLKQMGYSSKKLFGLFKNEKWILELFESFNSKKTIVLNSDNNVQNIGSESYISKNIDVLSQSYIGLNT